MRSWMRAFALFVAFTPTLACSSDDGDAVDAGSPPESEVDHSEHTGGRPVVAGARRINVSATLSAFQPDEISVDADEDVTIVFTAEDVEHDFVIDELALHVSASPDEPAESGLRADEAGELTFYCSVPGHREAGMEGTLTVREP